jgi:hypothetical protein
MVTEKIISPVLSKTNHLARERHRPDEIVHDLKNCMSIILLSFGYFGADSDHMRRKKPDIEPLESIVRKMNCLVEELAEILETRRH